MAQKAHVPKTKSDLQTRLGAAVRACRHRLGVTQEELAWRAEMHRTYIADIERGARNVTLRSVASLAEALGVSVGSLLHYAAELSPVRVETEVTRKEVGTILLVQVNSDDTAAATRALRRARLLNPLKVVRSAEEALDCLLGTGRYAKRQLRPQLVLLDLNLQQMSGTEFLKRLRADRRTRELPVLVVTVSQDDRQIADCRRQGANGFLVKPISLEAVLRTVSKLNLGVTIGPAGESIGAGAPG